jgi:hypothetical protein
VAVAVVTGLGVALLPLGQSTGIDANGIETTSRVSLWSNEGPSVLAIVLVPAVLVAVPLLIRDRRAAFRARVVIITMLGVFVVVGALSIGMFFVPTLGAMAAALRTSTAQQAPPG